MTGTLGVSRPGSVVLLPPADSGLAQSVRCGHRGGPDRKVALATFDALGCSEVAATVPG
ncbi:hypothetical protein HFP15_08215 [Amycolatopsis sp. K13G38]|uniref:Uncharacterized protein n=1 Tax=Amycolatopsis acididurans TaxID=2724524 RepID=A0ABX1IZK1_9PSEU|nr:hypothetical protein [Amycolatopsis acididurans]NKQ52864.1 hypothetical protein [Amycolatopsis acididurans]